MFFLLSKLLHFLLSPVTWIAGLLLWAVLTRNDRRKKRLLKGILLLFLFFSNPFILDEFNRLWEVPATDESQLGLYDAAIVLGGVSSYDPGMDRVQIHRSFDRVIQAIRLLHSGTVRHIIFTGGSGSVRHQDIKEGVQMKKLFAELGLPEDAVIYETESRNTHENATMVKKIIDERFSHSGKFLLITSGFHMNRSYACFTKEGIPVTPYSTDRSAGPRKWEIDHMLIPNSSALWGWEILFHEWVGVVTYWLAGYI